MNYNIYIYLRYTDLSFTFNTLNYWRTKWYNVNINNEYQYAVVMTYTNRSSIFCSQKPLKRGFQLGHTKAVSLSAKWLGRRSSKA